MTTQLPVAILGGGPVGLALALLLAKRRVPCVVFDARSVEQARADQRLLALSHGSWQTLAPLAEVSRVAIAPIRTVVVSSVGQFGRAVLDEGEAGAEPLGATIRYGDLIAALSQSVSASDAIEVRRPLRVVAARQLPTSVAIEMADGQSIAAPVALSAEGLGAADTRATHVAIVADVDVTGAEPGSAYERFTREGPLALLPLPARVSNVHQMALVWCMTPAQADRRGALSDAEFIAELGPLLGERELKISRVHARGRHPLNEQARKHLVEHRIAYLGNAAQTLHPVAGQGLNLGLRDSVVLADQIGVAHAAGEDLTSALQSYARSRGADRAAIVTLTRTVPAFFSTRFAPVALARSIGVTALAVVPNLRREFARLMMFGVRF